MKEAIALLAYIVGLAMGLLIHPGIVYVGPASTEVACTPPVASPNASIILRGSTTELPVPPVDIADDFNQLMKGDKK